MNRKLLVCLPLSEAAEVCLDAESFLKCDVNASMDNLALVPVLGNSGLFVTILEGGVIRSQKVFLHFSVNMAV